MEVVGEEGVSLKDMVTFLKSELYEFSFLQQNAFDKEDSYCPLERQVPLMELIRSIFDQSFSFESPDQARSFFLELQNDIKNMNFMPFKSDQYLQTFRKIEDKLQRKGVKHEKST
jgi:V/A-type H+-transporting ATPase subunit A